MQDHWDMSYGQKRHLLKTPINLDTGILSKRGSLTVVSGWSSVQISNLAV